MRKMAIADMLIAIKMLDRELEKFPDMSFKDALNEYNNTWYDGKLTETDLLEIEKLWFDTLL